MIRSHRNSVPKKFLKILIPLWVICCAGTFNHGKEISIEIDYQNSNTLHSVRIATEKGWFYPAQSGGVSIIDSRGRVSHPWSSGVNFRMMHNYQDEKNASYDWLMELGNELYYHYRVDYERIQHGLRIHFSDLGPLPDKGGVEYASVCAVYLDRCESALDPYPIAVPYLTSFNLLSANGCFVSLFFDWESTSSSQILPYSNNLLYSKNSVFFSQYALYNQLTNNKRNRLDEIIVLKVSENIDDVLPNLPNPISKYKSESSKMILFDDWQPFSMSYNAISDLSHLGFKNIWHIVHDWQRYGYDTKLPDVFPANEKYGGNNELKRIGELDRSLGYLFALHENYIDIFTASSKFKPENLARNSNGGYIFNWFNGDTSYLVKPTKIFSNLVPVSEQIKETIDPSSSYHDVSASYDPSKYVDYDYQTKGAGKFVTPFGVFKALADTMRNIYKGPVSSEGLSHFLYVGYYDDICAQIHTAKSLPGSYGTELQGGFYKPLFVDFDLLRMKEKALVHGVGYYERFFYKDAYWKYCGRSYDSALSYAATELAFGHGAFFSSLSYDFLKQGEIEYKYVYPVQLLYSNAEVKSIEYFDGKAMLSASDYIRKHPTDFDDFSNPNFMAQVMIKYDNGLEVYVNRHPSKEWNLTLPRKKDFVSAHCILSGTDTLFCGKSDVTECVLPVSNGWYCFVSN